MGIRPSRRPAAFECFSVAYEGERFRHTVANQRVARATREMFGCWFGRPLRPLARLSMRALLDETLLRAFALRPAPPALVHPADAALRMRARVLRVLPRRRRPRLRTTIPRRDYPNGYRIETLGPASVGAPDATPGSPGPEPPGGFVTKSSWTISRPDPEWSRWPHHRTRKRSS
ncbi:MAG TPA: hypothetical protein VMU47_23210 [Caldimonas sp.]|nr:hypothetical protein [Caldimonas sp.]